MTDPNAKPNAPLTMTAERERTLRSLTSENPGTLSLIATRELLAEIDALRRNLADREAWIHLYEEHETAIRAELDATRAALAARDAEVARLTQERDEAIGIGPGSNDGPFKHCECGRRMVWQYPVNVTAGEPGAPAWTCPNCTSRARRVADAALAERDAEVAELERERNEAQDKLDGMFALKEMHLKDGRFDAVLCGEAMQTFSAMAVQWYRDMKGPNYCGFGLVDKVTGERFEMTMQRVEGKSPHTVAAEFRERAEVSERDLAATRAALREAATALERWTGHLDSCSAMQVAASSGKRMSTPCSCGWRVADEALARIDALGGGK